MFQSILMYRKYLSIIAFIFISGKPLLATEVLQLMNTITINHDSVRITSVNPVGDFNNDGYDDMAITVCSTTRYTQYDAVYLYYGGPDFNTIPDLIFVGDTLHTSPAENTIGFGYPVALRDFNGDGFNDMAISASLFNRGWYTGRIYVYFGSTNPDTVADMILDGQQADDRLYCAYGGDYNGDGYGDMLVCAPNESYGHKAFIYLGGNPPDTNYDWSYIYYEQRIQRLMGNSDINGDGFDDFGWGVNIDNVFQSYVFLGNASLEQISSDTLQNNLLEFAGDISGDSIADFITRDVLDPYNTSWYLCLGGDPLDLNPDYYMWNSYDGNEFRIYHQATNTTKLLRDEWSIHRLIMYNTGVPFDTIPTNIFDYGHNRYHYSGLNIGDVNGDAADELAFIDSTEMRVDIYSIVTTDIEEHNENLPLNHTLITCYPNPFNSSTIIKYQTNEGVEIGIYNALGQQVKALRISLNGGQVIWDGTDYDNKSVATGVYFARVKSSGIGGGAKLLLLR